jgi:hypothetical protein
MEIFMETAALNDYIFASLVIAEARAARRYRQRKMDADGANDDDVLHTPLLPEDLRKGFETIEWGRCEVSSLLKEFRPDLSESR